MFVCKSLYYFTKNIHTIQSISPKSLSKKNLIRTKVLKKTCLAYFTKRTLANKESPKIKSSMDNLNGKIKKEEYKSDKNSGDQSWQKLKRNVYIGVGAGFTFCFGIIIYILGRPIIDENGKIIEDEFSDLPVIIQYFRRLKAEIKFYYKMLQEPSRDKLLPDPLSFPYVQPPYTLVLELKDLLVHPEWTYKTKWRYKKRPGLDTFLEQVGQPSFEVVVFTAEQGMTAFAILDKLDPDSRIMYRLFRDATDLIGGHHVKNLNRLNRDLKKVIYVDWDADSIKLHKRNAFLIPRWTGNDDDTTLVDLSAFLRAIAANEVKDVRDVLEYYGQFDNPIEAFRENQRKLLEQEEEEKQKKNIPSPVFLWSNLFLR